jgi:GntR family transcriptional regulator of gluconate operon
MILRREFPHGDRLVEESIASQFGVSRGPVRDAFRQLESEGLVQTRRRGIYVVGLTVEDIVDLYELREALEILAIKRTMARATTEQFELGFQQIERMRQAAKQDDHRAFADADMIFHGLVFDASGNHRLLKVWKQYEPVLTAILREAVEIDTHLVNSAEDHQALWQMISTKDPHALEEGSAHIGRARERMVHAFQRLSTTELSEGQP